MKKNMFNSDYFLILEKNHNKEELSVEEKEKLENYLQSFISFIEDFNEEGFIGKKRTVQLGIGVSAGKGQKGTGSYKYHDSHWALLTENETSDYGYNITINGSGLFVRFDYAADKYTKKNALKNNHKTIDLSTKKQLNKIKEENKELKIPTSDIILFSKDEIIQKIVGYIQDTKDSYQVMKAILEEYNLESKEIKSEDLEQDHLDKETGKKDKSNSRMPIPLNQILFGPPGTGKTYNTIFKTLDVLGERAVDTKGIPTTSKTVWFENEDADRDTALEKFNQYKEAGRIVFTTFHQSMSYEDFIEGIKPQTDANGQVIYKVEDGVFKDICTITNQKIAAEYDLLVADILNGKITNIPLPSGKSSSTMGVTTNGHINFKRKDGSDGDTTSKDRIIDMYKEEPDYEKALQHDYGHKGNDTNHIAVLRYIWEKLLSKKVLIIDEINRGNVANIFGELITLIEDDKRLGNPEAMTCTLPYSKKELGVPNNLYIIGTMNTADRSVEALDSALRRRFSFVEMMPKPKLLEDVKVEDVGNISLQDVLETINKRIEVLKDREHQIGHSYFMKFVGKNPVKAEMLKEVFTDKIIPLLQEYFYGDYEKIRLVLGDGFVTKQTTTVEFAGGSYEDIPEYSYQIVKSPNMAEALVKLMNIKTKKAEPAVQADADEA